MKRFKQLKIEGARKDVDLFLATLKSEKFKSFEYNRSLSENYAKMIFRGVSEVGCFKTSRETLFKSCVWLLISGQGLIVTNITSDSNPVLSKSEYNQVLDSFVDYLKKVLSQEVFKDKLTLSVSPEALSLSEMVPPDVYSCLDDWRRGVDVNSFDEDFLTYSFRIKAVVSLYKSGIQLYYDDFRDWLIEDCAWPESADKEILRFYQEYEFGHDILNAWEDEVER